MKPLTDQEEQQICDLSVWERENEDVALVFHRKDVISAVEWLKLEIKKRFKYQQYKRNKWINLIDEAFPIDRDWNNIGRRLK